MPCSSPQPAILREHTGSDNRVPQASPGAADDVYPLPSWRWRYGVALVAIGLAFLVRHLFAPFLDDHAVFMLLLCTVMISAWYGGLRPGLFATGLSILIIVYTFLPPPYTPVFALLGESVVLALFLTAGVGISLLVDHLHLARQRAAAWACEKAQMEATLRAANAEAEHRARSAEAAERLLHTLLEHVPEGITIATGPPDFPIIANSRLALELLGRPETDLVDIPVGQHHQAYGLFLSDGRTRPAPEQMPLYRACRLGETISNEEWVIERSDGGRITVLVNVVPIRDHLGQISGAISCWRDISAHKSARQLFELAVEAAPNAMFVVDQAGRIRLVNSYAEQLFGYSRQELVGQRLETLVPERFRLQHAHDRDRFMQQPSARPMGAGRDLYGLRKDGTEVPVEIGLNPIQSDAGSSILAAVVDITARQQLAAETERQQREDEAFVGIVQTLNASLDLDTVLQRVVEAARDLSHSERALIFLREPGAETMVVRYQGGYPEMLLSDLRIEPGKGIGGQTFATGRPQRTTDYATDPRFSKDYLPRMRAGGRLAVITVPITMRDRVEGVLYVSNPCSQPFSARDETVLLRLGAYAATAMHNAQLYQQLQETLAERQRAEAALQQAHAVVHEQRERLHVTLSSIGDAVMVTDSQGRVTFLNPVAAALTGWSEAEALGQDIAAVFAIVNEYTGQAVETPIARVIREGMVVGLANHTLLLARDGVERPIDDSAAPIRDPQGRLLGVVLVFRDITARRQAEEAQVRLAALVESSEDAIIGKTLEGIITSWNQGAERIYGYKAEAVIGRSLALLVPPDRPHELPEILARVARGEAIVRYETERVRQDGKVIPVALTISPIRDASGTIVGASTIARDITAQKQAEAEVERRRQETELLAEIAQNLSASLDFDTVLQRVITGAQELCESERALIMLRESDSNVLVIRYEVGAPQMAYSGLRIEPDKGLGGQVLRSGRPWRTDNYAADPRFSKEYLVGARSAGNLAVVAVPILIGTRVEGVLYVSNHASHPFTERDEEILERLAVHAALAIQNAQLYRQVQAELAERQKAEVSLAQAAAELEQRVVERTAALEQAMAERQRLEREAQRTEHFALLGRLAAGVSHELRNPLAAVFLHADLLTEELAQPSPDSAAVLAEYLAELKSELVRVDDIVQDYLSLVRVHTIQCEEQDLGVAVAAWCREFRDVVAAHGVTLQVDGIERLGRVAFHASTLRRALLNLVQNAAEAMPQGGTVVLAGQSTADQAQLEVRDTGSGIPAERLGQIFEPLHTTKPGGTGLGLHIVQEVATAHGGQVRVQSVEGQGTTFTLTLPRAAATV